VAAGILSIALAVVLFIFVRDNPHATIAAPRHTENYSVWSALAEILRNRNNYLTFLAFGLVYGGYMTLASLWGVPFLVDTYGLDKMKASGWATCLPLGMVVGALLNGLMVKVFAGTRRAVLTLYSGGMVMWVVLAFVRFPADLIWVYPYLLFLLGFMLSALSLNYTNARENNSERISGTALAFTNIGGFLSVALLQPITGWMLDKSMTGPATKGAVHYPYSGYQSVMILFLVTHVVALVAYYFVAAGRDQAPARPGINDLPAAD
jgi:sugar phosphate permease